MSEATEHEKQIAREAAERFATSIESLPTMKGLERSTDRNWVTSMFLAAITAAKQQEQNEDTARLLNRAEEGLAIIDSVLDKSLFPEGAHRKHIETIRDEITAAARGVQPAEKEEGQ